LAGLNPYNQYYLELANNQQNQLNLLAPPQKPVNDKLPGPDESGSVVDLDFFEASRPTDPNSDPGIEHGDLTKATMRGEGFTGHVSRRSVPHGVDDDIAAGARIAMSQASNKSDYFNALDSSIKSDQTGFLKDVTKSLQQVDRAGTKDSVVNISQGLGKSREVSNLMMAAMQDPDMLQNTTSAFGVKKDDFLSSDKKVSGKARATVMQGLVDRVNRDTDGNPEIAKAKSQYDQTVQNLADKRVFVAVAAGNEGTSVQDMVGSKKAAETVQTPDDYYTNPLSNSNTDTIGSVEGSRQNPTQMTAQAYSNPSPGVTQYANGREYTRNEQGTSFATPRYSSVESSLLKLYPNASHDEIRQMISGDSLSDDVPNQAGARMLDETKARDFLHSGALN